MRKKRLELKIRRKKHKPRLILCQAARCPRFFKQRTYRRQYSFPLSSRNLDVCGAQTLDGRSDKTLRAYTGYHMGIKLLRRIFAYTYIVVRQKLVMPTHDFPDAIMAPELGVWKKLIRLVTLFYFILFCCFPIFSLLYVFTQRLVFDTLFFNRNTHTHMPYIHIICLVTLCHPPATKSRGSSLGAPSTYFSCSLEAREEGDIRIRHINYANERSPERTHQNQLKRLAIQAMRSVACSWCSSFLCLFLSICLSRF